MTAAIIAQEAGDFAAALTYLRSAAMILAATPSGIMHDTERVEFKSEIQSLIDDIKRAKSGALGIQQIPLNFINPGDER